MFSLKNLDLYCKTQYFLRFLKNPSFFGPLCVVAVFDLFKLAWRLKALNRLVWIGLESQISDPGRVNPFESLTVWPKLV